MKKQCHVLWMPVHLFPWLHDFLCPVEDAQCTTEESPLGKLSNKQFAPVLLNLLHPNINIHTLHTVLFTFPLIPTRRICLTISSFLNWWSFPYSYGIHIGFEGNNVGRNYVPVTLRCYRVKGKVYTVHLA